MQQNLPTSLKGEEAEEEHTNLASAFIEGWRGKGRDSVSEGPFFQ